MISYLPAAYFLIPSGGAGSPSVPTAPPLLLGGPIGKTVERLAFEALGSVLRADPTLAANNVRVWPDPAATAEQNRQKLPLPQFEPNADDLPMVRIWPSACTSQRDTQVSDFLRWQVAIQCYAAGFDPLDAIDLWGAVRDAIWPLDPTLKAQVAAALRVRTARGAMLAGRLERQHDTPTQMGHSQHGQHVVGHITLSFNILLP